MKKLIFYSHGGSGNRGCEAIIRGTKKIIANNCENSKFYLCTLNKDEDLNIDITGFTEIIEYSNYVKNRSLDHIKAIFINRFLKRTNQYIKFAQKNLYNQFNNEAIAISVGGDNYCYTNSEWLYLSNEEAKKRGCKTVLWGCSLEKNNIDSKMLNDLKSYDLIIARESITYKTLLEKGINKNTKLYPDPAFQLEVEYIDLPKEFEENNTIGINLSPYIFKSPLKKEKVLKIYIDLINYIIKYTEMKIALIPHVFWKHNNDLEILELIYKKFEEENRVIIIRDELKAAQLKYIISKCKIFIGARTHSTIAAYSTCVPTLVLGYSVKSIGIARDIFGSENNMVLSVNKLVDSKQLIDLFEYIKINEKLLKNHLNKFMPTYKEKALLAGKEIKKII